MAGDRVSLHFLMKFEIEVDGVENQTEELPDWPFSEGAYQNQSDANDGYPLLQSGFGGRCHLIKKG
jgi:hypothetical protein